MVHAMCFVCSRCKCELHAGDYGCDMNGRFYCPLHMTSAQPSEKEYKTLAKGWLRKQGNIVKKWRRRYFVLEVDSCELKYYKSKDLEENCGVIDLSAVSRVQPTYLFVPPDRNHPKLASGSLPSVQLLTPGRVWNLACDTDSDREYWLDAIRTAQSSCNPASPAASHGVGRNAHDSSCSSPIVPTPKAPKSSSSRHAFLPPSPPPTALLPASPPSGQREIVRPSSAVPEKSAITILNSGTSTPDSDGVETNSPDDCSSTGVRAAATNNPTTTTTTTTVAPPQEVGDPTQSRVECSDGSADSSQSNTTTATGSNVDCGHQKRRIIVQPIIVPSGFDSGSTTSTPVTATSSSAQFMSPEIACKKLSDNHLCSSGLTSPVTWQPSTPHVLMHCHNGGWDCATSSGSSCCQEVSDLESRLRALSAGASIQPQLQQPVAQAKVDTAQETEDGAFQKPRPLLAKARKTPHEPVESSEDKEPLLYSPNDTPMPPMPPMQPVIDCRRVARLGSPSSHVFASDLPLSSLVSVSYVYV